MDTQSNDGVCSGQAVARGARTAARAELSPRVVTRGETTGAVEQVSAFVDWLGFSLRLPQGQRLSWLRDAICTVFGVPNDGWEDTGRGWYGYRTRINLGIYGLLAYGGKAQQGTFHVELNAHACALVQDWRAVEVWGDVYAASITRGDIAHDDLAGECVDIGRALEWYRDGWFTTSGRPPKAQLIDDLGSGRGKTFYVGSRQAGKLLRVYEKGKQLGDGSSDWVRVEVELRNKGRVVPWDIVTQPGRYLAGAYPALAFLSKEQSRVRTIQRAGQISYDAMVNTLRTQGGKALGVMCQVHQGDAGAVLLRVVREGVPKRLQGFEGVIGSLAADSPR